MKKIALALAALVLTIAFAGGAGAETKHAAIWQNCTVEWTNGTGYSDPDAYHHLCYLEPHTYNASAGYGVIQGRLPGTSYWINASSTVNGSGYAAITFDGFYSEIRVVTDTGMVFTLHHVCGN